MCSDIFCALNPLENIWSTTIQEAFAAGVLCTITKAGITETHLKHEETAYLIKSLSPRERAKAILALLENDTLRLTVSENEKNLAKDKWTIQKTTEELIKIYGKMLIMGVLKNA